MTLPKSSIAFPVLETLLKLLIDKNWHNKYIIKNQWKHAIPPEWFSRRQESGSHFSKSRNKRISFSRTIDGVVNRCFEKAIKNSLESEYIEIRELGAKRMENYDIRITDKGAVRATDGVVGQRFITINGETHSLSVWAKKLDLNYNKFRFWLYVKNVPTEEAIKISKKGTPAVNARMITHEGVTKRMSEWCKELGLPRQKMDFYLKTMTFEGAIERCRESQKE